MQTINKDKEELSNIINQIDLINIDMNIPPHEQQNPKPIKVIYQTTTTTTTTPLYSGP